MFIQKSPPLSWKHWHTDFYHLRAGNPKVQPCFMWVTCWWASVSSAVWAALQSPSGNPCRGPGHSLLLLGRRGAGPQRDDGAWWCLPVKDCCLWEGVRGLLCAFPPLMGRLPEQDDTMEPISRVWLYPTIRVRNAELLLIEQKQLTLGPVCCQGGTLQAAPPPVHLSQCSSATASPHTHTGQLWVLIDSLVCLMDHNSDVQFRI